MTAAPQAAEHGFRRRVHIRPGAGVVRSALEDDYHCMSVTLRHDGAVATAVQPAMHRAPWTTCPGAERALVAAFEGVALADFAARGGKTQQCTHLYDLALLAASHAQDSADTVYDIFVTDAVAGRRNARLVRNGEALLAWTEEREAIIAPAGLAGQTLRGMTPWINSLAPDMAEAARLLRWGAILAHGRAIPLARQSDASRMPAGCYTFQPERAAVARRVGEVRDFKPAGEQPLEALNW